MIMNFKKEHALLTQNVLSKETKLFQMHSQMIMLNVTNVAKEVTLLKIVSQKLFQNLHTSFQEIIPQDLANFNRNCFSLLNTFKTTLRKLLKKT